MKYLLFLFLVIYLFPSCNLSTSTDKIFTVHTLRDSIKQVIISTYGFPIVETERFSYDSLIVPNSVDVTRTKSSPSGPDMEKIIIYNILNQLEKMNMVKIKQLEWKDKYNTLYLKKYYRLYYTSYTQNAEKYIIGNDNWNYGKCNIIKIADKNFGEITGIYSVDNNHLQVEYTWYYSNITPFGKALNYIYNIRESLQDWKYYGAQYMPIWDTKHDLLEDVAFSANCNMIKYDDGWRVETLSLW